MKTTEPFKLYNTLSRTVEPLQTLKPGEVSIYTCGPTVYNYAHIGNLQAYIYEDLLVKSLKFWGYQVNWVMNVTDVGHLTSDEDEGEDKMEVGAKREGITAWQVAERYFQAFLADAATVGISLPERLVKATDTIKEQIGLIKDLETKGYTYQTEDGVYYDSSRFPDYGKLAKLDIKGLKPGARIELRTGKKSPTDFALWKFSPPGVKRDMEWDSPWGKGFPGWHIECSAIAILSLGPRLDIHGGGVDHIPVHHTNEIAQSEASTGQKFANIWFHIEHLLVDGKKMSKSLQNDYKLQDLTAKGFDPLAFRLLSFSAHYRTKRNFTWEGMHSAQTSLERLRHMIRELVDSDYAEVDLAKDVERFKRYLGDDLNLPEAVAMVWEVLRSDRLGGQKIAFVKAVEPVLGLDLFRKEVEIEGVIPETVQKLLEQRNAAREAKDWSKADTLRKQIEEAGYQVQDKEGKSQLTKIK